MKNKPRIGRLKFYMRLTVAILALSDLGGARAPAEDWPTFMHDNRRGGVTPERLDATKLQERWVWESPHPPQPAWAGPARWDAFAAIRDLRSMRDYDSAFMTIAVGDAVYFGSSAEDAVYCLDAATGRERWCFIADGPVRIAPTHAAGRIYFGADDGHAYCLNAKDGALVWKVRPAPDGGLIPSNGKFISRQPCRTGVLVADGKAYFAASLLPWRTTYLCAADAATGALEGPGLYRREIDDGLTCEGPLLASASKLYVPQGRIPPVVFDRATANKRVRLEGGGGVYCLLAPDERFIHGPGNKTGWLTVSVNDKRDKLATVKDGRLMLVTAETRYVIAGDALAAVGQKDKQEKWNVDCPGAAAMILAGDTLFVGAAEKVHAINAASGKIIRSFTVGNQALGLTAANGALLVSTSDGAIHCFR